MNVIKISGGNPLCGEVKIQGSKNASLPLLAAAVLIKGVTVIHNCPRISDVFSMIRLLEAVGCKTTFTGNCLVVDATIVDSACLDEACAGTMRSTITLVGAMLGRVGEVSLPYPGGCVIGDRPIDMHIEALKKLGVEFIESDTHVNARCSKLIGSTISVPFPSVGACQNVILAAVLAKGTTMIEGCSREPEVTELCEFLNLAGAKISGIGTQTVMIEGVESLHEIEYRVIADRIVSGTYIMAALATRGSIILEEAPIEQMETVLTLVKAIGAEYRLENKAIYISGERASYAMPFIETLVYPGFPTDLQSQLMVVLCLADGLSIIQENIFENRFHIVKDLNNMGAKIITRDNRALIYGVDALHGGSVEAEELRGGAALLIAGLAAFGNTTVKDCGYLRRGYENIVKDLAMLGGNIRETYEEEE